MVSYRVLGQEWTVGPERLYPPERVEAELAAIMAQVRAGVWEGPPDRAPARKDNPVDLPTFNEAAAKYMKALRAKTGPRNCELVEQVLTGHLMPHFGEMRMDLITIEEIERYMADRTDQREKWQALRERYRTAPETLTPYEAEGVRAGYKGLTAYGINRSVQILARIYTRTQEDHSRLMPASNPAKSDRVRLEHRHAARSHLDLDQLVAMLDAAREIDAAERGDRRSINRYALLATMALSGVRVGELVALRRRDVNLRAHEMQVGKAKTEAGVRTVQLTDRLASILADHLAMPTRWNKPGDLLFPTTRGTQRATSRVGDRLLSRCIERGDELLAERGLNPMPERVTNHTLRRTYVTLSLAYGESPRWLMGQVGHVDSNLVMQVYGQHTQRRRKGDPRLGEWFAITDD